MTPNASTTDSIETCIPSLSGLKLHFQGAHDNLGLQIKVWASRPREPNDMSCMSIQTNNGTELDRSPQRQVQSMFTCDSGNNGDTELEMAQLAASMSNAPWPSFSSTHNDFASQCAVASLMPEPDFQLKEGPKRPNLFPLFDSLGLSDVGQWTTHCHHNAYGTLNAITPMEQISMTEPELSDTSLPESSSSTMSSSSSTYWLPCSTSTSAYPTPSSSREESLVPMDSGNAQSQSQFLTHCTSTKSKSNESEARSSLLDSSRPYPCLAPDCDRWFKRDYTRRVHMLTHRHSKERKPFACSVASCPERFSRKHDRLRHEVGRHGLGSEWKCGTCQRFFSTKATMERHVSDRHGSSDAQTPSR
ncbi:hypothetical protein AX17_004319 [Amanita inopinata Kibby_2008]|nr:hypothetical protein AX17_004319 [Amanita inopinata Kibby_2008]